MFLYFCTSIVIDDFFTPKDDTYHGDKNLLHEHCVFCNCPEDVDLSVL